MSAMGHEGKAMYGIAPCDDPALRIPEGLKPLVDVWMRDTMVTRGPDGYYYLTGTTADPGRTWDPAVGPHAGDWNDGVRLWRSRDMKAWEALGLVWSLDRDATWQGEFYEADDDRHWLGFKLDTRRRSCWAPEIHWIDRAKNWFIVACTNESPAGKGSYVLRSASGKAEGPYENIEGNSEGPLFGDIDGSLFEDDDGSVWFVGHNHFYARMKDDLSGLAGEFRRFDETVFDPEPYAEGAFLVKHAGRYHLMNATWSWQYPDGSYRYMEPPAGVDARRVSYDCLVASSEAIGGPYDERYTAGLGIGHNSFFQDAEGQWWSTLFGNPRNKALEQPFVCRPGVVGLGWDGERFRIRGGSSRPRPT